MALREELERQGWGLFRSRSYAPLLLLPILLTALASSEHAERLLGDGFDDVYEGLCVVIAAVGLGVRCLTVGYAPEGTSERSTRRLRAETLSTDGTYSLCRHPLYLGNFLILAGIAMFTQVWWACLVGMLLFWIGYERIMFAEEEFLRRKFGREYLAWATATPAFWPRFRNWKRPARRFSLKKVLRSEYSGLFASVASFSFLEIAGDLIAERRWEWDWPWLLLFTAGLTIYVLLFGLKKLGVLDPRRS